MIKLPFEQVVKMLDMPARDVRYVLMQTCGMPEGKNEDKDCVFDWQLMLLLVYDLLSALKFKERDILAMLSTTIGVHLGAIGEKLGNQMNANFVLTIADNRYASLSEMGDTRGVYDFIEMEWVERIQPPLVSLAIVLPVLFQRAVKLLQSPSGQLREAAKPPTSAST